jgi:hypothetical protein
MTTRLVFETGKPSHEVWINFVAHFPDLNLSQIVAFLENTCAAKFKVDDMSWWLEFPDSESCTLFEITWL